MQIWIDVERTPREARDIVRRAGERLGIAVRLVTSHDVGPPSDRARVRALLVERPDPGDLVVTADTVVGTELARRSVVAIDERGAENGAPASAASPELELLESIRSFTPGERESPPYDDRARRAFAATLDRVLARLLP